MTLYTYTQPYRSPVRFLTSALAAFIAMSLIVVTWSMLPQTSLPVSTLSPDVAQNIPAQFIPNEGQLDPAVRFQAHVNGGTLFFTDDGVVMTLPTDQGQATNVQMQFVDAQARPAIQGIERLAGTTNYIQASAQYTGIPTYAGVTYHDLYNGIDARFDSPSGSLKTTYDVAPGANTNQIRWSYQGAERVQIDRATGALLVTVTSCPQGAGSSCTPVSLTESAPIAWQYIDGKQVPIDVRYSVDANNQIGFAVGSYNAAHPLTIDPTITFSTYYGGTLGECTFGNRCALAVDNDGNIYVTGGTSSPDFPLEEPFANDQPDDGSGADIFVVKLAPGGSSVIYSTYIANGVARGIATDAEGNAYVVGDTVEPSFPVTPDAFKACEVNNPDIVVIKLSADGQQLLYSTCIGGSNFETGYDIALDSAQNMLVSGSSASNDFPTVNPIQTYQDTDDEDGVVFKLAASGDSLVYSTYLGGTERDRAWTIDVDTADNAYVGGTVTTGSTGFPITAGVVKSTLEATDGFVTKITPTGTLVYSTYLGGESIDSVANLAVDDAGNVYALQTGLGFTGITKLNTDATNVVYSTEVESDPLVNEGYGGIAVDSFGNAYFLGQRDAEGRDKELVIFGLNPSGRQLYTREVGGSSTEEAMNMALYEQDGQVDAYVLATSLSDDFPVQNPLPGGDARNADGGEDLVIFNITDINEALVEPTPTPTLTPTPAPVLDETVYMPLIIR